MSIRFLAAALALSALWGCAAPVAREPLPAPVPADAAGQRAADLLRHCAAPAAGEAMACRERALLDLLAAEGVAVAMATLERMGELDEGVRRDGHVYAHAIGLAAYTTADEVGAVFGRCTPAFQSGCYHGVIQSYFVDQARQHGEHGVPEEALNALCAEARAAPDSRWQLFQCAHGMGHGLTMLHGYDLRRALQGCDAVRDPWEREACLGGVFMENIVQATAPHHTTGRPQQHHAEGGHAHHDGAQPGHHAGAEPPLAPLDPADPLHPCSALEERYLQACYGMQTSAILYHNGGDMAAAATACGGAPEAYRATCYQSLGRDVSTYTAQRDAEALRLCALAGERHRADCYVGYVKNLVDLSARPDHGFRFCRAVRDPADARRCYQAVGEQIWALARPAEARAALCTEADPEYADACRRGAGVG